MIIWRKAILFKCIYVVFSVGIGHLLVRGEDLEGIINSIQSFAGAEFDFDHHQGKALVESNIRFPTVQSFFLWLGSFQSLENEYSSTFTMISDEIPQKSDYDAYVISMKAYSSVIQCLELMRTSASTYSMSLLSPDTDMFSEVSDISVNNIIKECLTPCTHTLLDLYIKVQILAFESEKVYSPALLKASERILELYHNVWEMLTLMLGYVSMIRQTMNRTLQHLSEIQNRLLILESKQKLSALEQLELNISRLRLKDLERKKSLCILLLSVLEGDLSLSVKASEMESLIITENKRCIFELEESISVMEKSIKCEEKDKASESTQLISSLKTELETRTEELSLKISGTPIYRQTIDANLQALFEKLNSELSALGTNDQPGQAGEAETSQTVLEATLAKEGADPTQSDHLTHAYKEEEGKY